MGQFTFFAIILVCLAIAFAVSALWQKSRGLAIVLALALPIAAGALYWFKGEPKATDATLTKAPKSIEEATTQLEKLTTADPSNFGDMVTLARAYMASGKYEQARDTYARAAKLEPKETAFYVEWVESMLRSSPQHSFSPEAVALLEQALKADPQNQRALFFYGLYQRQSGQPAEAVATWEKLLALLDAGTSTELRKQIAAARADAGMPEAAQEAALKVKVNLDPTLAREVQRGAVLFVFARATGVEGGPPVAAKRLSPERFPVELELSDADSPMPTGKLFSQPKVVLVARLSRSGVATSASGDLESDPVEVEVKAGAASELTLSRSIP
jgi:cytochrome c-type biogenesis protein CcmH